MIAEIAEEWDEGNYRSGDYTFRRDDDFEININRPHDGAHSEMEMDEDLEGMVIIFIAFAIIVGFLFTMIFFTCCCGCVFLSYFKLYTTASDYEHMDEMQ